MNLGIVWGWVMKDPFVVCKAQETKAAFQGCLKELLKWYSLHHAAVTHSVFECSLRRMQPLNWDTTRITNYTGFYGFFIMVWAVFSCVQAVFFIHCKRWHVGAITDTTSKNQRFYFETEWYLLTLIQLGTLKWQQYVGQNIYQINISVELPLKDHTSQTQLRIIYFILTL